MGAIRSGAFAAEGECYRCINLNLGHTCKPAARRLWMSEDKSKRFFLFVSNTAASPVWRLTWTGRRPEFQEVPQNTTHVSCAADDKWVTSQPGQLPSAGACTSFPPPRPALVPTRTRVWSRVVKKIKKVCFKYFLLTDHHVNLLMFQETPKPMSLFCPVSQHEIKPWRFANAWPVGQERKSLFHKNSEHSKFRTVELSSTALLSSLLPVKGIADVRLIIIKKDFPYF